MITIIAMLLIAMLLIVALANEINGTMLAGGIAIIAGLGGYTAGKKRSPK